MASIRLRTGAWMEEAEIELSVPDAWRLKTFRLPETPALPEAEIRRIVRAALSRHDLAKARTAAIVVDDLSRPTPAAPVCTALVDAFADAGIAPDRVSIVVGGGAHRPVTDAEARQKAGEAGARVGRLAAHDAYASPVAFRGVTALGTPVLVNRFVADADFTVTVSGVIPLAVTGFGGGAKMLMPGVSHISSIYHNHERLKTGTRGGDPSASERRRDIEDYGRVFGLNLAVCVTMNGRREITAVFAGPPEEAYREGVAHARTAYASGIDAAERFDFVIANAYPMDHDPFQLCKSTWGSGLFSCPVVLVSMFRLPDVYHGLACGPWQEFVKKPRAYGDGAPPFDQANRILYNPHMPKGKWAMDQAATRIFASYVHESDWRALVAALSARFPGAARVAVLPTAPIQY
jgi:lactate racemase